MFLRYAVLATQGVGGVKNRMKFYLARYLYEDSSAIVIVQALDQTIAKESADTYAQARWGECESSEITEIQPSGNVIWANFSISFGVIY